ncbi:MAG: hypothetical protein OEV14_08900 [Gammaproteobacteria bacterium]|nr:hypothetical protein [Gammaproteobacteria bacterium]
MSLVKPFRVRTGLVAFGFLVALQANAEESGSSPAMAPATAPAVAPSADPGIAP